MKLLKMPERPEVNSWPLWGIASLLLMTAMIYLSKNRDEVVRRAANVCAIGSTICLFKMGIEKHKDDE